MESLLGISLKEQRFPYKYLMEDLTCMFLMEENLFCIQRTLSYILLRDESVLCI